MDKYFVCEQKKKSLYKHVHALQDSCCKVVSNLDCFISKYDFFPLLSAMKCKFNSAHAQYLALFFLQIRDLEPISHPLRPLLDRSFYC